MIKTLTAVIAVSAVIASTSSGNAMGLGPIGKLSAAVPGQTAIIKVHSRRQSHDMLHDYGYRRVHYLKRRSGYDSSPIYVYQGSKGYRDYHIAVDYYGNIVGRHRVNRCYGQGW